MIRKKACLGALVGLILLGLPSMAWAAQEEALPVLAKPVQGQRLAVAALVAGFITQEASEAAIREAFDSRFLERLPPAQLQALFAQLRAQGGAARVASALPLRENDPTQASFVLHFEKALEAKLDLVLRPEAPHRIQGLLIGALSPHFGNWKALEGAMASLPGRAGLAVWRLPDPDRLARAAPTSLASLRADEAFAIGSAFKLVLLHALVKDVLAKRRAWEDVLHLQSAFFSLPSGRLQAWPNECPVTLASLAGGMLSESDNTATDLLLRSLGRGRLEREVKGELLWRHADRNLPFLSTREMFTLKDERHPERLKSYLAANLSGRRAILDGPLAQAELEGLRFATDGRPVAIDQVEWFASPGDLAGTMHRLARATHQDPMGRGLLAINPGLSAEAERWPYVGFKGGSEPGVLSLNWLLKRQDGVWFSMSFTWNRPDAAVRTEELLGLAQAALSLLSAEP